MIVTDIKTVKYQGANEVIINDITLCPILESNRLWRLVQDWESLGNTISPEFTDSELLQQAKDYKSQELNTNCDATICGGFTSTALGTEHYYQSGRDDQLNLLGLKIAGVDANWKTGTIQADGITILWELNTPHTASQIQQVFSDGVTFKMTQLEKCDTLKKQVDSATTVAEVEAIVW